MNYILNENIKIIRNIYKWYLIYKGEYKNGIRYEGIEYNKKEKKYMKENIIIIKDGQVNYIHLMKKINIK